jgi:hypothetical protein
MAVNLSLIREKHASEITAPFTTPVIKVHLSAQFEADSITRILRRVVDQIFIQSNDPRSAVTMFKNTGDFGFSTQMLIDV